MSVYYLVVEKPFMVLSQKLSKSAKPKYVQG